MTGNWKFKCALAGLLLTAVFVGYRSCQSFHEAAGHFKRLDRHGCVSNDGTVRHYPQQ